MLSVAALFGAALLVIALLGAALFGLALSGSDALRSPGGLDREPAHHPVTLPASAFAQLTRSLEVSSGHPAHPWRDPPPVNADGSVNGYIEVPRGERDKWEFEMRANARVLDRIIPAAIGGYPVNYGFVPQTVSYDGDPFDVLVLGTPRPGGKVLDRLRMGLAPRGAGVHRHHARLLPRLPAGAGLARRERRRDLGSGVHSRAMTASTIQRSHLSPPPSHLHVSPHAALGS